MSSLPTGPDVAAWAAGSPAPEVATTVAATPDHDLESFLRGPGRDAVPRVLERLADFTVPARLAEVRADVAFATTGRGGVRRVLRLADGTASPVAEDATADVEVAAAPADLLRLVCGGANAAMLLLGGRLTVTGDGGVGLAVGGLFARPGQPDVAVDPTDVDPEQVARLLKGVPDKHLRAVMTGGFREVVLDQVFTRFPEFVDHDKAARRSISVGFTITGRPDGGSDRWAVTLEHGSCLVERDVEARQATITADGADFLKLATGHLNPMAGVVRGRLKVRGDLKAALALHGVMRVPGS